MASSRKDSAAGFPGSRPKLRDILQPRPAMVLPPQITAPTPSEQTPLLPADMPRAAIEEQIPLRILRRPSQDASPPSSNASSVGSNRHAPVPGSWPAERDHLLRDSEHSGSASEHNSSASEHSGSASMHTAESGQGGLERKWLVLCLKDGKRWIKYVNVEVTNPPASDQGFFKLLQRTRNQHCSWGRRLFWKVTGIKLIRFVPSGIRSRVIIHRRNCIPPRTEVETGNWTYQPVPATHSIPIDSDSALGYYYQPDQAATYLALYMSIPKRLRDPVTDADEIASWAVQLEETKSFGRFAVITSVLSASFLIPAIVLWVVTGDAAVGFTVTSALASAGGIVAVAGTT